MSKTTVELYVPLALPAVATRDAAMRIFKAIGDHVAPYEHVSLSLGLRDLQIPIDADVNVPITAHMETTPQRWECKIEIEADSNKKLFPHFTGTLSITPNGHDSCELWLQGSYDVPMGLLGSNIDVTFLRGSAQKSLERFLEWLAGEIKRSVNETERERARQARGAHY
jgi:hypothetical protein